MDYDYLQAVEKRFNNFYSYGGIVEKSFFDRGNMIMVQGIRSGNEFIAKNYKNSGGHQLYKINKIYNNGDITLQNQRKNEILEEGQM